MIRPPSVGLGTTVSVGQVIGYVGSTGSSSVNHLHIDVRINGATTDPHAFFLQYAGQGNDNNQGDIDLTPEQDARLKQIESLLSVTYNQAAQANSRVGAQRNDEIAAAVWNRGLTEDGKPARSLVAQTWSRAGDGARRGSTLIEYVEAVAQKVGAVLPTGLFK